MEHIRLNVTDAEDGIRLDRYLASRVGGISRSEIQRRIRAGEIEIDGRPVLQPSRRTKQGESIVWEKVEEPALRPVQMDLTLLYEDDDIVVVDKPAGVVVHPGAGNQGNTLVEGLLYDRVLPHSDDPVRPGIVHRLDKGTSGVIVVAKTAAALASLKGQFARREVRKIYLARVEGKISEEEGLIDAPIGRDAARPRRMVVHARGRLARTEFRVLARDEAATLVLVRPVTGRTHQIRVHFHHIGHPVMGDPVYGREGERLMLHAWRLAFRHPTRGGPVRLQAPVPQVFPRYPYDEIAWCEPPQEGNPTRRCS